MPVSRGFVRPVHRAEARPALRPIEYWTMPVALLLLAGVAIGAAPAIAAGLALVLHLTTVRDRTQFALALALASLVVATAPALGTREPELLRFALLAAVAVLTATERTGRRRLIGRMRTIATLFMLVVSISLAGIIITDVPRPTVEGVAAIGLLFVLLLLLAQNRWSAIDVLLDDLRMVHRAMFWLAAIGIGLGVLDRFASRTAGIHGNPNTFAYLCLLGFALDLGLRRTLDRSQRLIGAPLFLLGILASGSRGALVGALLAPLHLLLRTRARTSGAKALAGLGIGLSVLLAFPRSERLDPVGAAQRTFGGDALDLSGRQEAWTNMLSLWRERPVLGRGLRTTEALGSAFASGPDGFVYLGHSSYLQVLVEVGLIGFILTFGAIAAALVSPPPTGASERTAWVAGSSVVTAGLGHMTGESFLLGFGAPFPLVFWMGVVVTALTSSARAPRNSVRTARRFQDRRPLRIE
ncbi:MAG: hypothetical protein RLZZ163_1335 [Actinomycetota bacterium]